MTQRNNTNKYPSFDTWFSNNIEKAPPLPNMLLVSSFEWDSKYAAPIREGMQKAEFEYALDLLKDLQEKRIDGCIVEFGVFRGQWIESLWTSCSTIGLQKQIYGFDSFEGLPNPGDKDCPGWHAGQYAASYDNVRKRLQCDKRNNITLVKGWFSDSFRLPEIRAIEKICYARIDSDLYSSAIECLDYLKDRLVDGAVLVFDDWTWWSYTGEVQAFYEWLPTSRLRFEFLACNGVSHLYLRVHKQGQE